MRLHGVEIANFRCIERFVLDLIDPETNAPVPFAAIVGPNGSGKTSVLELIARVFRSHLDTNRTRRGVRVGREFWISFGGGVGFQSVHFEPSGDNQPFHSIFPKAPEALLNSLYVPASRDPRLEPALAIQPGDPDHLPPDLALSTSPTDTQARVNHIHQWLMHARLQQDVPALWEAVSEFLHPIEYVGIRPRDHALIFDVDGRGTIVGFNDLSSGQRKLILLIAEIIHHCDGKGLLLIDEPESHFHPRWQRRLREFLTRLLPEGQIIVATHSPFIIHGIPSQELFMIDTIEGEAP